MKTMGLFLVVAQMEILVVYLIYNIVRYNCNLTFVNYFNAIIPPAVEEADTAVIIPGIKPDADTNVNTELS